MAEIKNSQNPLPQAESTTKTELPSHKAVLVENALTQALPVPDIVFGGSMLVLIIMFHAFWIRFITSTLLKRMPIARTRTSMWRADLVFAMTVLALLALHLSEVMLWSVALVVGGIVDGWAEAAYFAANCYTALGEPFSLPHAWRMLAPIVSISGIFTFAWTASVLVDFVSRLNKLRAEVLAHHQQLSVDRQRSP
jgi:hypothetical protein